MILVEIGEPSLRRQIYDDNTNQKNLRASLELLTALREKTQIRNMVEKQRAARKYNSKLRSRVFVKGDLVWRMANTTRKKDNKFFANWEGL